MVIINSSVFRRYPEIIFGFSTKIDNNSTNPYYFNLSLSVGDNEDIVRQNRTRFYKALGLSEDKVVLQRQTHSSISTYVEKAGLIGESDALITDKRNLGLAVSVADCTPVFLFDPVNKVIAAIHSGWRGTQKRIVGSVVERLEREFNSKPENLSAYIGPSISQDSYEVGKEVAELFEDKYLVARGDKFLLDVKRVNYDMLLQSGILKSRVQLSGLCTYKQNSLLHSYRRDGSLSGRLLGIIAMKDGNGH
ncbi:MAG: peptidoglycan editing factor PgeF [Ignavibacteriales bacterium]